MQLRYLRGVLRPVEGINKVTAIAWSPNTRRLAAVTMDRIVHLFDENGERRDKFSTKPSDPKGPKTYLVRGLAYSPDSSKLAVAQSDNILFVYKLGLEWGDKKSICNKFPSSSAVTCAVWPSQHAGDVVYGLAEGKVKIGQLRSNKSATLFSHPEGSPVVSLACNPEGNAVISGHQDGSIYRFLLDDGAGAVAALKLGHHFCVPVALAWGESVAAAGNDCKVVFYGTNGVILQQFDYSGDEGVREFTSAAFNPTGDTVILGAFNRFVLFSFNLRHGVWEEVGNRVVENIYSLTALAWKPDGSRLAIGGLCGAVDLFDACIRRQLYKGKFEFTYVSKSQVIVKRLSTGTRIVLKSMFGQEILKINVYRDQYIIAHTPETLLMGDLEACKLSEVPWSGSGNERFYLDNPQVCMIFNVGELHLVEYGGNEVLGTCRTEHMNPYLISVRLTSGRPQGPGHGAVAETKKIAFLIDLQTIRILDLISGVTSATINHDCKIDWLELNPRATHLLFRDKKRQLHLFNLVDQERATLLNYCSYVQWVPTSDVVVAQNRGNLCVWYSIANPERVTVFPIKGEVEDIERSKGRTEVIVDEGINTVSYALDESLIEFGSAIEDRDYERAVGILEPLELTPETEAMWQQLSGMALEDRQLSIAERCYSALGDVAKARFLHKVNSLRQKAMDAGYGDGMDHYAVRARLAMLKRQWKVAEALLLEQGKIDDAIQMYTESHRWKEAIAVAESKNHPEAENLKRSYYKWLISTGQEEAAGAVKEAEGDQLAAIALYLKGGLPGRAAQVVTANALQSFASELLEQIAAALGKAGMHERAGDFFEKLGQNERALESYRRGHAHRRAVDLARRVMPKMVVELEEEWGDWLVSQKAVDAAINHFIEARQSVKAIEAAIDSRQWAKAVQIVDAQDPKVALPFYKRIARHYESVKNLEEAERFFVRAKLPGEAVEMYTRAGKWEAAQKVAARFMSETEASTLFLRRARELEAAGKLKEAEKMYLDCKEHDLAINMYKKARMYDHMIRLVAKFRKDLLVETHLHLAQQLESDGSLKEAEHHYVEAKDWKSAVQMYRANDMWEDALRVAKLYGGANASKQVAYAWAVSLGGEAGAQLLTKLGLVEQAVDYAVESGAWAHAFELCRVSAKAKVPEVHLKYAMFLEDEGRFKEAEEEFVKADKPKEAIDMYIHQLDWPSAMRVAEQYDPQSIQDIQVAQARVLLERKEVAKAEAMFLKAKRPDLALKMYRDLTKWDDAIRIAEDFLPAKVSEVHAEIANAVRADAGGQDTAESVMSRAKTLEHARDYSRAIDLYLNMTKDLTPDMDYLEQVWETAVKLAMNYVHDRISEVVSTVSKRLIDIGRYEQAAELHEGIDAHKEAIDVYILGGLWDKARALGSKAGSKLAAYVEEQYKEHLLQNEEAEQLVMSGSVMEGLELYARHGEWEKVHQLALQQGAEVAAKYAARHAKECVQNGQGAEAAHILMQYGAPAAPALFDMYKHIAREVIGTVEDSADGGDTQPLCDVKVLLQKLLNSVKSSTPDSDATRELTDLLTAVHYLATRAACRRSGINDIASRLSVAILRFVREVPADKAFYEAGMAAKQQGWLSMAFVFLNRYLDLAEAMDDPDGNGLLENSDFVGTDIPHDFAIPEKHFLDEERREQVRDYVLELSMDQQVEQSLPTAHCDRCGSDKYVASAKCASCKSVTAACVVSGYPIVPRGRVNCSSCDMAANSEDWNKFILKCRSCPWCGTGQNPVY